MDLKNVGFDKLSNVVAIKSDVHWSHRVAAVSLAVGAVLLMLGRKREALAVAGAGAATTLLERPEAARELWSNLPGHIRNGQDFLVRAESFIEQLGAQAARIREMLSGQR